LNLFEKSLILIRAGKIYLLKILSFHLFLELFQNLFSEDFTGLKVNNLLLMEHFEDV
jgi:hypothetical protein